MVLFLGCYAFFVCKRLGHPPREWKPEFKERRYPPLDAPACWALVSIVGGARSRRLRRCQENIDATQTIKQNGIKNQ